MSSPSSSCEYGFHEHLTMVPSDGYGMWVCDHCGELVDELAIMNRAITMTCEKLMSEARRKQANPNANGCFGDPQMNEIVSLLVIALEKHNDK